MATVRKSCAAKRYVYVWEGPVRISHWLNVIAIVILSVTGYYINNPFIEGHGDHAYIMGNIRYIHYLVGVIFAFSIILRLYWLFVGNEHANWHSYLNPLKKENRPAFWGFLRYYSFLQKNPPYVMGHNPVALLAYVALFNLFVLQVITGFVLWAQADPNSMMFALTDWISGIISLQWLRWIHHIIMFLIWGFVINHIYSAVLFDFKSQDGQISAIFTGWKPDKDEI